MNIHAVLNVYWHGNDRLLQVWVVYHLQIIGEAVRRLPPELLATNPTVPWREIVGLRHILVHQYFEIDVEAVWRVVQDHLEPLVIQVQAMLEE